MTRKDYELLTTTVSEAIKDINQFYEPVDVLESSGAHQAYAHITNQLATVLSNNNKAFDKERFLKDCGVED